MNFGFTEEQELLREQIRRFLDDNCPVTRVREIMQTGQGFDIDLWNQMAGLGWLGLIVPEGYGGMELTWVDLLVLFEETGRSLFPSPLVSHTLAQLCLVEGGSEEQKQRVLPATVDGNRILVPAFMDDDRLDRGGISLEGQQQGEDVILSGTKYFVSDVNVADTFIVAFNSGTKVGLALVYKDQEGVSVEPAPVMDPTKNEGQLNLQSVYVSKENVFPGEDHWDLVQYVYDCGAVSVSAEAVGTGEAIIELTTNYAKERIQFDAPIGKYQGVKHPLADMYVDIESGKSLTYFAAWCITEEKEQLAKQASMSKAWLSDKVAQMGIDCIQLHGAIGYTEEYDAQLYFKRSKWFRPVYGNSEHHYQRVSKLGV